MRTVLFRFRLQVAPIGASRGAHCSYRRCAAPPSQISQFTAWTASLKAKSTHDDASAMSANTRQPSVRAEVFAREDDSKRSPQVLAGAPPSPSRRRDDLDRFARLQHRLCATFEFFAAPVVAAHDVVAKFALFAAVDAKILDAAMAGEEGEV